MQRDRVREGPFAVALVLLTVIGLGRPDLVLASGRAGELDATEPTVLLDFGVGPQHRVWFDSTILADRILVAVSSKGGALDSLDVSVDCLVKAKQEVATLSPPAQGRELAVETIRDRPVILTGSMQSEAFLRDGDAWHRSTLIPRADSGVLRYRSLVAAEEELHIAHIETRYGQRQLGLDAAGRVSAGSAERHEVLRYFSVSAAATLELESDEIVAQWPRAGLPRSLDIQLIDGMPAILLASQDPSGKGQLDLYRIDGESWSRSTLVEYGDSTPPLCHLGERGAAYARRAGVGLYRFEVSESGQRPEQWSDWSPRALESTSGLLAWTDARRAGQRWWGNLPFIQLINPNNSPNWLNNDVLVNRDFPKILTPWPVRVEQFRIHRVDDALLLLWLGYRNFNGRAEVFEKEPLSLFCQRFDWSLVQ